MRPPAPSPLPPLRGRTQASLPNRSSPPPPSVFSPVFILKGVKVVCFDTLLQVLILNGLTLHQNCAKCSLPQEVLILKRFKSPGLNTSTSVDSGGAALRGSWYTGRRHTSAARAVRRTAWRERMA